MGNYKEIVNFKVICLDDTFHDNLNYLRKIKVNDILTCSGIQKYDTGNTYYVLISDNFDYGNAFLAKEHYHIFDKDFKKYFKSVAIMREERINKIFND